MSPSFTASPTFLFHFATLPSVIVSERRGILITSIPAGISNVATVSSTTGVVFSVGAEMFSAIEPPISAEISSPC